MIWIIYGNWIVFRRSHTRGPCAICYGVIRTFERDGVFLPEEQVLPLDKMSVNNSMHGMGLHSLHERINLLWRGIIGVMRRML